MIFMLPEWHTLSESNRAEVLNLASAFCVDLIMTGRELT